MTRFNPRLFWLVLISPVLFACGRSASGENAAPTVTQAPLDTVITRTVVPSDTWPTIQPTIGDHFVAIGPAANRRERLFVYYPGTGARPDRYSYLLKRAASLGYHAIGLAYHNKESINYHICPKQPPTSTCYRAARHEILLGTESGHTPPQVNADNSAFHRLRRLLAYLAKTYPDEGWERYLDADGEPIWNLMAFGGHSQGGGHAAMTAQLHAVDRVLLFDATEPMTWASEHFETEKARFFGFVHTKEPIYDPIVRSWDIINLPGTITNVDTVPPPYKGSHRLATSYADCRGDKTN
ncbi:MAG: hypothetical protein L0Y32_01685, partial [Nevskiales bacterium]|nr:hypothetical protein [Nevskiales bacterium]